MAKEYLDKGGLLYFWQKIKNLFSTKSDTVKSISRSGTTFTATRADGTTFNFSQHTAAFAQCWTNWQTDIHFTNANYNIIPTYASYSTTNSDEISGSNNGVTVHRSGIYLLKGSLMFTSVPSELLGNVKRIQMAVNGSVVGNSVAARLNAGEHIQIVQPRYLNAGDLVQLVVQCDNQTSSSYCVPAWWNLTVLGTL